MLIADRWQTMSVADGAVAAASLLCACMLSTAIYRLYFHPLAQYPGPFWARLTTIPSWWHTRKGNRHIWLFQLQEKYGTTFRYRPDSVLVNTPTAYRTIFGPKGNVRKSDYYQLWPRTVDTLNTWNCTNIDIHTRKRRVLNNAFSDKALRSAEPFILANVDRWCELLGQEAGDGWSKSLNVADWINYLVFDILGDLCFGRSFDMKEPSSQMRYVIELMGQFLQVMHPIAFSPIADFWLWLKPRGLDTLMAKHSPSAVQAWEKFVDGCLAERTRVEEQGPPGGGAPRKDFFHYLFGAVDPETGEPGYGQAELYGECELLIIAGSDTTSTVLSALFFYLVRDEAVQARLVAELRGAFASAADIRAGPALTGCQYLHAFVQEGLRMTPPVSAEPSRQVLAGGATVDGHFFPAGTRLSTGLYCLSYNPDVYPEPFRFRPERFLPGAPGTTPEGVAAAQQALCAFSSGTRGCPGKNLAWLEMTVVVAKVLFAFDVRPNPASRLGAGDPAGPPGRRAADQYQTYDAFVSLRDGPMVQFKRREGA